MSVFLPIENIHRRADTRHLNDEALAGLADSINVIGLINPIRVRPIGDGYEVIAGAHRFAACDLLGLREIACIVVDDDDLHAELAMIDENLCRAELSAVERAEQTARRKKIYLAMHPETAEHVAGGKGNATAENFAAVPSFAANTAAKIGQDERTVRLHAERGEKVIPEVMAMIRDTKLNTGTYLDKLKKQSPNDQVRAAKRDLNNLTKQVEVPPRGGIAGRIAPAEQSKPLAADAYGYFIELVDKIEALSVPLIIDGAGQRRAVLGQRTSSLIDRLGEIMEGLDQ